MSTNDSDLPSNRAQPENLCPLCGGPNECAPAKSGDLRTPCWCRDVKFDADLLARVPEEQRNRACICLRCAAQGTNK